MSTTERPRPYRVYTMADLTPIFEGKLPVPNLEEMPAEKGLERLAHASGGIRGRIRLDPKSHNTEWATWFPGYEGMGSLGGNGLVVWSHTEHEPEYRHYGKVATFAICRHEFVAGPGGNPSRGWNPGFCRWCGMDLSVDSGD